KYFFLKPFSIAFRGAHYGRYGKDAFNDLFYPLFLGYPGYMRGFDFNGLQNISNFDDTFNSNDIQGTKMLLGGLELKVPFTGPERSALISSGYFFTELNWFIDAGITWNDGDNFFLEYNPSPLPSGNSDTGTFQESGPSNRFPVFSTGPSVRINLFGAIILEPYYAIPFTFGQRFPGVWGLSFWPGW
ncbi:MAG: tolB protein precursor, partial [Bacteroidota bacterium]